MDSGKSVSAKENIHSQRPFAIRRRRLSFCEKLGRSYQRVQHDLQQDKETRTLLARQAAMSERLAELQERLQTLACHKDKVMAERRDFTGRTAHCFRHGAVACVCIALILQINSALVTWCLPDLVWEEKDLPLILNTAGSDDIAEDKFTFGAINIFKGIWNSIPI